MARIKYLEEADVSPVVRAMYYIQQRMYNVPTMNSLKVLAYVPELMQDLFIFTIKLLDAPGRLGKRLKSLISIRVPCLNQCRH